MNYTPGAFLDAFAETAIRKVPDKADALRQLFGSLREVTGFPRGATYTDWRRRNGKAANASLTVEVTASGADVILNPMEGSNPADAAWTFAGYVARALYPDIVTDGKTTVQRAEHAKFKALLGIDRQAGEVIFSDWPELPYPPPIYHGSPLPDADRAMISFAIMGEDGTATRDMVYLSLVLNPDHKDHARDVARVMNYYQNGLRLAGLSNRASGKDADQRNLVYQRPKSDGLDEMRAEIKAILEQQAQEPQEAAA